MFKPLTTLRNKERSMENQFNTGDLVWAKLHGHPWWPSIVYNEALTTTQVQKTKKEGFILVSFFGDNSYEWLDPKNLLHFESNYRSLSNRSNSRLFLKAVYEAVYEVNHRAALGLTCPCSFFSSYRNSQVEGFLEVDIDGYSSGGFFSVQEINRCRQEFKPVQTLSFVQILALDSRNVNQDLSFSKEVARVLAFRKAKYAEVDEPYFLAFKVDPKDHEIDLIQAPADDPSEAKTKDQKMPTIKHQSKNKSRKDEPATTKTNRKPKRIQPDESNIKSCEDHVPHKKRHVKVTAVKKTEFISVSANDDNKKVVSSSVTTTKCDDVKFVEKLQSSDTSMPPKTCQMRKNTPPALKPFKKRCTSPKIPQKKEKKEKKEEDSIIVNAPQEGPNSKMVLSMNFPPGTSLPSTSELKAKFVVFGKLDVSSTHVSYMRSRCQVVFMNKSDAEKAYKHAVNSKHMFSQTNILYRLHQLQDSKQTAIMPQHAHVASHNAKYQQTDKTCMQVNQGKVDISEKMLYLLNECSRIVHELKQSCR